MSIGLIRRNKKQYAVYWGNPVPDGSGGYTVDAPVELLVRWAEVIEEVMDSFGERFMSKAVAVLNDDLVEGPGGWGFLKLGRLADLRSDSKEPTDNDAWKIRAYRKAPTFRGTQYTRKAWM